MEVGHTPISMARATANEVILCCAVWRGYTSLTWLATSWGGLPRGVQVAVVKVTEDGWAGVQRSPFELLWIPAWVLDPAEEEDRSCLAVQPVSIAAVTKFVFLVVTSCATWEHSRHDKVCVSSSNYL